MQISEKMMITKDGKSNKNSQLFSSVAGYKLSTAHKCTRKQTEQKHMQNSSCNHTKRQKKLHPFIFATNF